MRLQSLSFKVAGVVEVFDDAIINHREIIRYVEHRMEWQDPRIGRDDGTVELSHRNNTVAFFDPFSLQCPSLLRDFAAIVWAYLDDYAKRYDITFSGMESVNINRYQPGQFYKPHADAGPTHNREISALVYLNDVVEGGETEFIFHGESVVPKAGRLVIFPSNYAYAHAAHPPTTGNKYSVAFWTVR